MLDLNGRADAPIMRTALLLGNHPAASWTVGDLARRVGVSRSVFYDRFKRALGCAPSAYLYRARMEEALVLPRDGLPIDEVAQRVGYRWSSSFTVTFRRHHGKPPSALRRRN